MSKKDDEKKEREAAEKAAKKAEKEAEKKDANKKASIKFVELKNKGTEIYRGIDPVTNRDVSIAPGKSEKVSEEEAVRIKKDYPEMFGK